LGDFNKQRPLRVFEAFAGIGAQATALERLGAKFEIVGISEWMVDAVICYDAIHNLKKKVDILPTFEKQMEYLSSFEFSRDSNSKTELKKLEPDVIEKLYIANKRSKNYGSISQLKGINMPTCDLLIYSFPCQDLSTGGNNLGMKKGSGTRSSLLWEIERILSELQDLNRLPKYLLMENVKNVLCERYSEDLSAFLRYLESIGYKNDKPMLLNALDFGVPQDRVRAFIVSKHGKQPLAVSKTIESAKKPRIIDSMQFFRTNYSREIYKHEADIAQLNQTPSREVMWKINGKDTNSSTIVKTITCNMDRTRTAALFKYNGALGDTFRRLTIREAYLLMGFSEEEYEKTIHLDFSYRRHNKLIGNSIVVNVLVEIFREMFVGRYNICKRNE